MKAKKCGVFAALTAVLFITAALVTSCPEALSLDGFTVPQGKGQTPFAPPEGTTVSQPPEEKTVFQVPEGSTVFQTPEGNTVLQTPEGDIIFQLPEEELDLLPPEKVGYLRLKLATKSGGGARTILPDTSEITDLTDFTSFDVYFASASSYNVTGYISEAAIALPEGTYTAQVVGIKSGVVKAAGDVSVTITAGDTDSQSVTLKEIVDGEGDGTFSWALTNPGGVTTASMVITGLSATATASTTVDLLDSKLTSSVTLKSGYYRVDITLEKADSKSGKVIEALHIYEGFDSPYTATALPTLKTNVYTVTFALNDGSGDDHATPSVTHGGYVPMPADPTNTATGKEDWIFGGWYTDADWEAGDKFTFNDDDTPDTFVSDAKILKAITLYAKWIDPASLLGSVEIEIVDVTYSGNATPLQLDATDISWDIGTDTGTITITVTNDSDYQSFEWVLDADTVSTDESVTLNFELDAYKIVGDWRLTLFAVDNEDVPYSATIIITVSD